MKYATFNFVIGIYDLAVWWYGPDHIGAFLFFSGVFLTVGLVRSYFWLVNDA